MKTRSLGYMLFLQALDDKIGIQTREKSQVLSQVLE